MTSDVDVLFNVEVVSNPLRHAVVALMGLGYRVDPASPAGSTHRYLGPSGQKVDVLAPAGVTPKPDLTTTPPGRTIEVYGGLDALISLVDDPEPIVLALGPRPAGGHFAEAAVLDDEDHHSWRAASGARDEAALVWDELRRKG